MCRHAMANIDHLVCRYLQFFFNLSLVLGMLYIMFYFIRAVQKDVEQKMAEHVLGKSLSNVMILSDTSMCQSDTFTIHAISRIHARN